MALAPLVEQNSFQFGEVSSKLSGRRDLAQRKLGVRRCQNMVVLSESVLTRRPGTRFTSEVKDHAQRGKLIKFRYTVLDNYMLLINGGVMRVFRNGGVILDGLVPFELAVPYVEADLPNLRWRQLGDTVFIVCSGHPPRKLKRIDHDDWTLTEYQPTGGPVKDQNLDESLTIITNGVDGPITLTVGFDFFTAGMIGRVMRLDESSLALIPTWKPNETISIPTETIPATGTTNIGNLPSLANLFDNNPATESFFTNPPLATYYGGRSYTTATRVHKVTVKGYQQSGSFLNVTYRLWGKQGAAPAHSQDGIQLGEASSTNATAGIDIVSNQQDTIFDHLWVEVRPTVGAGGVHMLDFILIRFQAGAAPVLRRYLGIVYQAIVGTNTGVNPPVHLEGAVLSEGGTTGVSWQYLHRDRGYVRITAVASGFSASADVLERLPNSVAAHEGYRWFAPDWTDTEGYPDRIHLHDGRLTFHRGNRSWITKPTDINSLEESGVAGDTDSALAFNITSQDGSLPQIEWVLSSSILIYGLRDSEFVVRGASVFDALAVDNLRARPKKQEGSAAHIPCVVDGGALMIGRSRKRLHFVAFDDESEGIEMREISRSASHLLAGQLQTIDFQRDPHRIAWMCDANGLLIGLTFNPEEKIFGWHRHPMTNGVVEDVACVGTDGDGTTDVYLIVRRTIDGETKRYVERLQDFFEPADEDNADATGAWFVDCGLRYQGAPEKVISGLLHLKGQIVAAHANGRDVGRFTVSAGGTITLKNNATDVIVGLPIEGRVKTFSMELDTQAGSTVGLQKQSRHALVGMDHSAGGKLSINGGTFEPLHQTGGAADDEPIALRSGIFETDQECPDDDDLMLDLLLDSTMPFTLTMVGAHVQASGG